MTHFPHQDQNNNLSFASIQFKVPFWPKILFTPTRLIMNSVKVQSYLQSFALCSLGPATWATQTFGWPKRLPFVAQTLTVFSTEFHKCARIWSPNLFCVYSFSKIRRDLATPNVGLISKTNLQRPTIQYTKWCSNRRSDLNEIESQRAQYRGTWNSWPMYSPWICLNYKWSTIWRPQP